LHTFQGAGLPHRIHVARDGDEALEYLICRGTDREGIERSSPRLILLSLTLPHAAGFPVLRVIRNDPRTKFTPLILLVASVEEERLLREQKFENERRLRKPLNGGLLLYAISQIGISWFMVTDVEL
jgi:two-component system response regulator